MVTNSKNRLIKVLAFDIGGVLTKTSFKDFHAKLDKLAEDNNIDPAFFKDLRKKYSDESMVGKITYSKFKKKILGELKVKGKLKFMEKWEGFLYSSMMLNKELYRLVGKLKKKYYLVSFSNVTHMFHKVRHKKRVYNHFIMGLSSHEIKLKKPQLKFYKLLIKKVKVKSSEILFIDDLRSNLVPAKKLGMKTILYVNNQRFIKDLNKFGVNI